MGKRRKGREIVLQSMYASLISGAQLLPVLEDQIERRQGDPDTALFARDLAGKVKRHSGEIDRWLKSLVTANRAPERLGTLEIVILSLALAELKYSPEVPYKAVINEAIELAHRYCDDGAAGFVNGVLDRAAEQLYPRGGQASPAATPEDGA